MIFAGLQLFLFLVIVRPQDFVGFLFGKPVVFIVMAVVLALWLTSSEEKILIGSRVDKFAAAFFLAICLSTTSTRWITYIYTQTLETLKIAVCYLFVVNIALTWRQFKAATWTIVLLMGVVAAMGVLQHLGIDVTGVGMSWAGDKQVWQIRGAGNFDNPNDLAYSVVILFPFALSLFFSSRRVLAKLCAAALAALSVYCIYLTRSRGGLLALVVCFGCWLFLWTKSQARRLFTLLAVAGVVMVVAGTLTAGYRGDASSMGRVEAWAAGMDMLRSHPLVGVGKGQFPEFHERDAHSSFVRAGAELGLLGLYAWLGMLLASGAGLIRAIRPPGNEALRPYAVAYASYLGAYLSASLFSSRTYDIVFLIVVAMVSRMGLKTGEDGRAMGESAHGSLFHWPTAAATVSVLVVWKTFLVQVW